MIFKNRIPGIIPAGWRVHAIDNVQFITKETVSGLQILYSVDCEGVKREWVRHISFSRLDRYPDWDEMKDFIYACDFFDPNRKIYMVLPAKKILNQYVNMHRNCFHWWQNVEGNEIG